MFDKIAAPYDRLNRLISLGRDRAWRATAVRMAGIGPGARVVDVGCGTGDFILAALEAMRGEGRVVGLDLAPKMVEIARQKTARIPGGASVELRTGNAAATGVPDGWADAVTMGWVVRNLGDRRASYDEVMRVLKPGGRFVSLDSSRPASAFMRAGFSVYLHGVMPVLVRLCGGDREAYRYLAASTERFLTAKELAAELRVGRLREGRVQEAHGRCDRDPRGDEGSGAGVATHGQDPRELRRRHRDPGRHVRLGAAAPESERDAPRPRPSADILRARLAMADAIRDAAVAAVFRKPSSRRRLDSAEPSAVADTRGLFRVFGTVVTHGLGDVVPGAPIRAIAGFDSAQPHIALAEAEEDGTFSVDLPAEGVIWVSFNVETPLGAGAVSIDLEPPFTGTRDLGDVELKAFKTLAFKVLTMSGDPIEDAMVQADSDPSHVGRSGPDGTGALELDREVTSIRAVAAGFGLVSVPVSPGQQVVEARLAPAATLTIQVTTNDGPPNSDTTRVSVEWAIGKFPVELKPQDLLWVAVGNTPAIRAQGLAIEFDQPSVTMGPMLAGVPIRVSASEAMSKTKETRELVIGAAESRVVTLPLRSVFHRLRGRVVTAAGDPVSGATVLFGITDFSRTTDENGTFDFGAVAHKVVHVRVSTKTHALWESNAAELDGEPIGVTLEEGVPLSVKVRDIEDRPVKGASVYVCDRFDVTGREGEVSFQHVPLRSVLVRVFYDGRDHLFHHHTAAPEVIVKLEPAPR